MPRYEDWSRALLDETLPEQTRSETPVLLSCDDDAVVRAGVSLGVSADGAAASFGAAVEQRYHLAARGSLEPVRSDTVRFRSRTDRATAIPPFVGVCAVMVLAASRMTSAVGMTAGSYYDRLWEALGRRPGRASPYEFDYAPYIFRYLGDWLAQDLGGARGRLLLAEGGYPHVGSAINQCVFREHDHGHLAEFFARRLGTSVHDGTSAHDADLLRLLEICPERHHLTRRAQQALAEPGLRPLADAALHRALARWDGTVSDPAGGTSWPARLHLSVNRGLGLALSAPSAPMGLVLDGENAISDRPVAIDLAALNDLAERGLHLGAPGSPGVFLPPTGDTLVFEVSEDAGLVWTRSPSAPRVHILSRAPHIQRALYDYATRSSFAHGLPDGWRLYQRVPTETMPETAGVHAPAASRPPVTLIGGLRVASNTWLTAHPPRIQLGEVDRKLAVLIDDAPVGVVGSGGELQLALAEGDHRVDVGDGLVSYAVHMVERNPARPQYGALRWPLGANGRRVGSTVDVDDPSACGATLSTSYTGPLPLLVRVRRVHMIALDGTGSSECAPPPPAWLGAVGLDPQAARWEVPIAPDTAWVLTPGNATAIRPIVPATLDAKAKNAILNVGRGARVRAHDPAGDAAARAAFNQLQARATNGEPAS